MPGLGDGNEDAPDAGQPSDATQKLAALLNVKDASPEIEKVMTMLRCTNQGKHCNLALLEIEPNR